MNRFDEQTHTYWIDEIRVPSVTQILSESGLIDSNWFTEESRERGKSVHAACQYFDEEDLDWDSVDEQYKPYIRAYEDFKKDSGFVPDRIEERVFHKTYFYAGTLDRTGKFDSHRNAILDIKTGQVSPWAGLQLAAYDHCLEQRHQRYALQLKPNGTYKLHPFNHPNDLKVFLSALTVVHWKRNQGGNHGNNSSTLS